MLKSFLIVLYIICIALQAGAQSGAWLPAKRDSSYPRTLMKARDIPGIRKSLSAQPFDSLYHGIFASAFSQLPAGNSSTGDRHLRAIIAKNAAFVLLMDVQPYNSGKPAALSAVQRDTLSKRAIMLMANANTFVDKMTYTNLSAYDNWQWYSKCIIRLCIAYDLMKGVGYSDSSLAKAKATLQQYAGNLYQEATRSLSGFTFFNTVKNNHSLMTAAALGMAATVLNNATSTNTAQQPVNWINAALWNIDNVLWKDPSRQSDSSGVFGYGEGPYYFKYAFDNCLPFFRAIGHFLPDTTIVATFSGNTSYVRNPYYDPKYELLCTWARNIHMPDGRLPAIDDSYIDFGMPELALTGKRKYVWPMDFSKFSSIQANSLNKQLNYATDLRADYIAAQLQDTIVKDSLLTASYNSGDLVFRSGWDTNAIYLHMQAEHGRARIAGGGHNQADDASFIIEAYGQLLALDPGYINYNRRQEVDSANKHNTILVDGAGPLPGIPGNANGADVYIRGSFYTPGLSWGEIATNYTGTSINRNTLFARNRYFLLGDLITSTAQHSYTWQLHGYGLSGGNKATGIFRGHLSNNTAVWEKNGIKLQAVTGGEDSLLLSTKTNEHELAYNKTENHTTLLAEIPKAINASFVSCLYPSHGDSLNVHTMRHSSAAALSISDSSYHDLIFTSSVSSIKSFPAGASGLTDSISSDAGMLFFSEKNKGLAEYYLQNAQKLVFGGKTLARMNKPASLLYQVHNVDSSTGYSTGADTVALLMNKRPYLVSGPALKSWRFDAKNAILYMHFLSTSDFSISTNVIYSSVIMPSENPDAEIKFDIFPNPFAGTATISFRLPYTTATRIEVYDIYGRLTAVVVNKALQQGRYSYTIDENNCPEKGIYLVNARLGDKEIIRKVIRN